MPETVVETLASSSAHGISRAAATQSLPLRLAWILLFLCFLGLFCYSALDRLDKLMNVSLVTIREDDKVEFQFPDLYLCPANQFSGSYPFALNASEAASVNREIEGLEQLYDQLAARFNWSGDEYYDSKIKMIMKSMSPHGLQTLLLRPEQSLFLQGFESEFSVHSLMIYCFKLTMTADKREQFAKVAGEPAKSLVIHLFTDPYNKHIKYSGYPVKPVFDTNVNQSVPVELWHPYYHLLRSPIESSGFTLYAVPQGSLASQLYDEPIRLSTGFSYDITLSSEQVEYASDLYGRYCNLSRDKLAFVDPITGERVDYTSSKGLVMYDLSARALYQITNGSYISSSYPVPWDLRDALRWGNLTDMKRIGGTLNWTRFIEQCHTAHTVVSPQVDGYTPCEQTRYGIATLAFQKWPFFIGNYTAVFFDMFKRDGIYQPAINQWRAVAEQLDSNPSATNMTHPESMFRSFLADSWLELKVRGYRKRSPRLMITYTYSGTQFLSDIGGLSGLYIGCSLLTFFELLELLYQLVMRAVRGRRSRGNNRSREEELTAVATEE